ncbi:CLUMA_CG000097, isoform A [Clunio marinus]|uniref:CLUMA_CG000097, isoform A n=1 Tax=Clunio marinus TaxID=568069 RepID=A0A1J1HEF1_9DIPT|nr:CLUMA_CG000097, isoform A [Clunio marinus]
MQSNMISPLLNSSRGARFLDLVRQKTPNLSPQIEESKNIKISASKIKEEKSKNENEGDSNFLTFSSELKYNPNASPRSSILSKKRSFVYNSGISPSSSVKRKRVGFRDPVASTKKYIVDEEEPIHKSNNLIRCLVYDNENIQDYGEFESNKENAEDLMNNRELDSKELQNVLSVNLEQPQQLSDVTTSEITKPTSNKLIFNDKDELLEYVSKNIPFNELFDKYNQKEDESLSKKKNLVTDVAEKVGFEYLFEEYFPLHESQDTNMSAKQHKLVLEMLNSLSKLMAINRNVKHRALALLSDNHSDDFLEHALRENSTKRVCDKISVPNIVGYLIHKVNISENVTYEEDINKLNKTLIYHLINNTHTNHLEIVNDTKEIHQLLNLLFKNKSKLEILDTAHEFVQNIVKHRF